MTYVCIKCRVSWTCGEPTDEVSGGLCESCIGDYIRKKQRNSGHHDCFMRNTEICAEDCCCYWDNCNSRFLKGEE